MAKGASEDRLAHLSICWKRTPGSSETACQQRWVTGLAGERAMGVGVRESTGVDIVVVVIVVVVVVVVMMMVVLVVVVVVIVCILRPEETSSESTDKPHPLGAALDLTMKGKSGDQRRAWRRSVEEEMRTAETAWDAVRDSTDVCCWLVA